MEYFRRYLIQIRRFQNEGLFWNLPLLFLIISIIGLTIGLIVDLFVPFNYVSNMFRGVIAIITGITMFSSSYLYTSNRRDKILIVDRYYKSVRERFSYKQRLNFSILVGTLSFLFVILGDKNSVIFTLKSSLFIFLILTLTAFTRRLRDEFIKDIFDIPDLRDLESKEKRKELTKKTKQ